MSRVKAFLRLFQARRLVRLLANHSTGSPKKPVGSYEHYEMYVGEERRPATVRFRDRKRLNNQNYRMSSLIRTIKTDDAGLTVTHKKTKPLGTIMATQNFLFKQKYGPVFKKSISRIEACNKVISDEKLLPSLEAKTQEHSLKLALIKLKKNISDK